MNGADRQPHHWVESRLGVRIVDRPDPLGLRVVDLAGLAVRRNPRRAHLIVSRVLGKHLPTDPRIVYASGRLLGQKVAAALGTDCEPRPLTGLAAALTGDLNGLPRGYEEITPFAASPLVVGYAETATALGHSVFDTFTDARYLHSTRRAVSGLSPAGVFDEAHSHAARHLLSPMDPGWLRSDDPVVLVDDELTTGRTALATIRALHRIHPHRQYVIASLLDLRTEADRTLLAATADELDTRVDVVALATGEVLLPADVLERGRELVDTLDRPVGPTVGADRAPVRRMMADWPAGIPEGGRHGFSTTDRAGLAAAVRTLAGQVRPTLPDKGRILVLGTEELMYTPLRLATELTRSRDQVFFSSTTRSPVLAVNEPGYAIRTCLRFEAADGTGERFVYNVAGAGFDVVVLVVDQYSDTPALQAPGGLVEALRMVCGALTVAIVPDRRVEAS